ncbi:unnamed protein product [Clonostachys rosea]|uniref:Epoxide hydrolase N-terminal domain-containing protein n=1 Tax=Bionectria ochroleuca TaxID=29856 RepID=A0ABY6U904_BIOOC|nr:unnamed protein product [Clonostachys rosea]
MASVKQFRVHIPQYKIDRLTAKLATADFPPNELDGAGWDYGVPLADVRRITEYWKDTFNWRQAEAELNEMPQFKAPISLDGFDPIDLHFVHAKSPNPNAIPLLFCHGWPGSFDEVSKILPLLLDGGKEWPSFHVVAPSMPNYGFSSGVRQKGFGVRQTAEVFQKLMVDVLGYNQYTTQGGDLGYLVSRYLGFLFPSSCKASHYNFQAPKEPDGSFPELMAEYRESAPTESILQGFRRTKWFQEEGMGYHGQHSTKPQTLGYGLADSPVGLLAWIYEKLHDWTDDYPWTDYEICKWVSIYWFSTPGPLASLWLYYDMKHTHDEIRPVIGNLFLKGVKLGCSNFPKEVVVLPSLWNKTLGNVVFNKEHGHGGHFAAFECPNELVGDLREMFGRGGGAYGVIKGKLGETDS